MTEPKNSLSPRPKDSNLWWVPKYSRPRCKIKVQLILQGHGSTITLVPRRGRYLADQEHDPLEGHMKSSRAPWNTGRTIDRLAGSPKARLLATAFFFLSLHWIFKSSLSAVPLVPTLLSWGAILCVGWVLAMHSIEFASYVVEAFSDLVVTVLRSIRRVWDCWCQEWLRPRVHASRK